jgi:hypothetical protein
VIFVVQKNGPLSLDYVFAPPAAAKKE